MAARLLRALGSVLLVVAGTALVVPSASAVTGTVLYVVASPGAPTAGESAVRSHLTSLGTTVVLADDTAVTTAQAAAADLVVVGHSVSSSAAATKALASVATPVWVSKPWLFDDFGLTGRTAGTDYGEVSGAALTLVDPAHPMAAGRSGTVAVQSGGKLSWGLPAPSATVVAAAGSRASVFTVGPGAALAGGGVAPACRLTFPLMANGPASFTPDGWALFDAAVDWALADCTGGPVVDDPPSVELSAPADGAAVSGVVPIAAEAGDDVGVARVRFAVDGVEVGTDATAPYGVDWDSTTTAPGPHTVTATAEDTAGQTAQAEVTVTVVEPTPPPDGGAVLYVVNSPAAPSTGEIAARDRLAAAGFEVTLVDDAAVTPGQASAADFVLISPTVGSNGAAVRALAPLAVPVWVAKPYLFDDFGLTGRSAGTDFASRNGTALSISAAGHPMAGGLTGTVTFQTRGSLSYGRPAAAATVIARAGTDASAFTLPPGQPQSDGSPAPACRLTFPLMGNAPATFTSAGWTLFDAAAEWAASNCGTVQPDPDPDPEPDPEPPAGPVQQVVLVSIDGLNPDAISALGPAGAPNLHRLMAEGVSTLNARTIVEATQTLPNHTSMVTGRGAGLPGGHGVLFNEDDGGTVHAEAGGYVVSIFDLVHDAGWSTALYGGKVKFDFLDRSWDGAHGALDSTGTDDGRDKIDTYLRAAGTTTTDALLTALTGPDPAEFAMIHYPGPDQRGHTWGYMSAMYLAEVSATDALVGRLLDAVAGNPDLAGGTVVIVTSDHGGLGTSHADETAAVNYTVPFFAWGAGVAAGADLYALNPDRTDPGTAQPPWSDVPQPVRNAEAGNLAARLLGLGAVPGSTVDAGQTLDLAEPAPVEPAPAAP